MDIKHGTFDELRCVPAYRSVPQAKDSTRTCTVLGWLKFERSGLVAGAWPLKLAMPRAVYWLSKKVASSERMEQKLSPESGFEARAIDTVPRTCGSLLNSAFNFLPEPPHAGSRPGRRSAP